MQGVFAPLVIAFFFICYVVVQQHYLFSLSVYVRLSLSHTLCLSLSQWYLRPQHQGIVGRMRSLEADNPEFKSWF